jgi:hypothetical protein
MGFENTQRLTGDDEIASMPPTDRGQEGEHTRPENVISAESGQEHTRDGKGDGADEVDDENHG